MSVPLEGILLNVPVNGLVVVLFVDSVSKFVPSLTVSHKLRPLGQTIPGLLYGK